MNIVNIILSILTILVIAWFCWMLSRKGVFRYSGGTVGFFVVWFVGSYIPKLRIFGYISLSQVAVFLVTVFLVSKIHNEIEERTETWDEFWERHKGTPWED